MAQPLKLTAEIYQDQQECINLTFINPWDNNEKAKFAMLMWPAHSIEVTSEVEKAYEETAKFIENSVKELAEKDLEIKILRENLANWVYGGMGMTARESAEYMKDMDQEIETAKAALK